MGDDQPIMVPVVSSNVSQVGYLASTQTLRVEYNNGGLYDYPGVPQYEYDALLAAQSVGGYIHSHIKPYYSANRV